MIRLFSKENNEVYIAVVACTKEQRRGRALTLPLGRYYALTDIETGHTENCVV